MLGEMVRVYRRHSGMSQEALAEACRLSVRGIRKIEGGRVDDPRPATIRLLADALGPTGVDRDRFLHATAGAVPAAGPALPRQLPADVHGFTGRMAELAQHDALLPEPGAPPPTVVISAIGGTAGAGKTALAVHWAHQVADRFPDGQLYVNLRGFDPSGAPLDPRTAVRAFLDALGVPPQRIPADEQAQYGLYRSNLAGRRMLIVLDNARDAEQVRSLLPGGAGCLAMVTASSTPSSWSS